MNHSHEKWQDEFQGKVPHGRGQTNTQRTERDHYYAPQPWEHQVTGTSFSEADREQLRRWQIENDLINSQGLENLCSMS